MKAQTPAQYLAGLPEERRAEVTKLHRAICKTAPKLEPAIQSSMIGYGSYHYKYPSGREGDWPVVALACRKNYISLYLCVPDAKGYLAEQNEHRLGKVSVGRSCINFKKLEDLDLKVALELVEQAAKAV